MNRLILLGALTALVYPMAAGRQERVVIEDARCAECRIRLTRVAVIEGKDPYTPSRNASVVKTRNGYAAAPLDVPATIGVFDSTGRFLKVVGSTGAGPHEFSYVASLSAVRGDSVLAFDRGNGRIAVLDPELRPTRIMRLMGLIMSDIVQVADNRYAARMRVAAIPQPLHLIDGTGRITGSFGPPSAGASQLAEDRRIVFAPNGRIYAAKNLYHPRNHRYEIEEYDGSGRLLRILERQADWFTTTDPLRPTRPPSFIRALGVDEQGRLLVLAAVPVLEHLPTREEAEARNRLPEGHRRISLAQALNQARRIVEVIDLDSGTLVASAQSPDLLLRSFVGQGEMVSVHADANDITSFSIWRLAVTQTPQTNKR